MQVAFVYHAIRLAELAGSKWQWRADINVQFHLNRFHICSAFRKLNWNRNEKNKNCIRTKIWGKVGWFIYSFHMLSMDISILIRLSLWIQTSWRQVDFLSCVPVSLWMEILLCLKAGEYLLIMLPTSRLETDRNERKNLNFSSIFPFNWISDCIKGISAVASHKSFMKKLYLIRTSNSWH